MHSTFALLATKIPLESTCQSKDMVTLMTYLDQIETSIRKTVRPKVIHTYIGMMSGRRNYIGF